MIGGARNSQTKRFVPHLIIPNRLSIRMKENVRVASISRALRSFPAVRSPWRRTWSNFTRRSHRLDPLAAPLILPIPVRLHRLTIKDVRGLEKIDGVRWLGGGD